MASATERTTSHRPRIKPIDRNQIFLEAVDVERLIDSDHLVRGIWAFVCELDLTEFSQEIKSFEGEAGRSALAPELLISLWLYAYSQGIGKARVISRLCRYDPAFRWLTGLQQISYHTLSDFRVKHKEKLDHLLKQILAVLDLEGIIDLRRVFHDGSKIQASASDSSFRTNKTIEMQLRQAEELIERLESEESDQQDKRIQAARQRAAREKAEKLKRAVDEFKKLPAKTNRNHQMRVSATDPDARRMFTSGGGYAPSYNAQITVEAANGFIVAGKISQSSSDFEQLEPAVGAVEYYTGRKPEEFVVDSGFASKKNIINLSKQGIKITGPLLPQSSTVEQLQKRGVDPAFSKEAFRYDAQTDSFICPADKTLKYIHTRIDKASMEHIYVASVKDCQICIFKERCCGKKKEPRRRLIRSEDRAEVIEFKERMQTLEAQQIYKLRAQFAEFPLAWLKEKFGVRRFCVRGVGKVATELVWLILTFDILQYLRIKKSTPIQFVSV